MFPKGMFRTSTLALAAFACIGTSLVTTVTFAQTPAPSGPVAPVTGQPDQFPRAGRGGGGRGGGGMRRKLDRLNLSESQRSQIQEIFKRYKNDRKNPAFKQEINAVLTPEQREQLRGRRGGMRRGRRRLPPATTNTPTAVPKAPNR
jgi:Spy/CpxP family protein refolding chaperone